MSTYENRERTVEERLQDIKNAARDGGCSWDDIRARVRALTGDNEALYTEYCKRVGALPS
jgi:hypothetical protein